MRISRHYISWRETVKEFNSDSEKGLTEKEARIRQKKFGENKFPEAKPFSKFRILVEQFKSPLIYILIIAGAITLALGKFTDSIVIFLAVAVNAAFGYIEENKISETVKKLKKILKVEAVVLRDGEKKKILREKIVPGDIIFLNSGDRIPADGRLIEAENLKISEASLTGEWIPAEKINTILPKKISLADRDNMVYMGTVVEAGQGKAIVTKIGMNTEMGRIARMLKETEEEKTPIQKKLFEFSRKIGLLIGTICIFIFLGGIIRGQNWVEMFETSIAVAVGGIPEALPIVMTVILAVGMERILKKKGLIRRLSSVETLGSASVICIDKTRTLTKGKMELSGVFAQDEKIALEIGIMAAQSFIENPRKDFKKWKIDGSSTDNALILGAAERGILKPSLDRKNIPIFKFPFNADRKYVTGLNRIDQKLTLSFCGAPEKLIELSKKFEIDKKEIRNKLNDFTKRGLRVVGVAYKKIEHLETDKEKIEKEFQGLTFVGLIALKDPLRKGAKEAFKICQEAQMRPIIITGDHQNTAVAVAKELGMEIKRNEVIQGSSLDRISDNELRNRVEKIKIYARAEPRHKMRIVKAWQKRGEVVAMTGDGVNDAPALKKADIGLAVGSGTEVAKEASDLVILNDSFEVIVKAVREGRVILDNIRKSISYVLADSFTSLFLIGSSFIFGWPLPILPVQILWNNLIEDTLPDIAYAFEPEEEGVMKRKPTSLKSPLLNKEMKVLIFGTGLIDQFIILILFWILWGYLGLNLDYCRTMVFGAMCLDTCFVVYCYKNLRKNIWQINPFSNKFLVLSSVLVFLFFILTVYFPPLQTLLKTVPLGLGDWLILAFIGIISMFLIEITKWWFISKKMTEK
jgi:Ca2+-transporting ATPase